MNFEKKENLSVIILAAGEGTRMKSDLPKVLHPVCGKSMIRWVIDTAKSLHPREIVVLLGHKAEEVEAHLSEEQVSFTYQEERLGTGHAAKIGVSALREDSGDILVLYGDSPMMDKKTLEDFISFHRSEKNTVTVLTASLDNPHGYGRIIRSEENEFLKIVEENDATESEKKVREINSGMYCFRGPLMPLLKKIGNQNKKGEYYLTDAVEITKAEGKKVGAYQVSDETMILAANNRAELSELNTIMQRRINLRHMTEGVSILDPKTTYIEDSVQIGRDTIILPGTMLKGNTTIGKNCEIGPHSMLTNVKMGDNVTMSYTVAEGAELGSELSVGPFVYLRPETRIMDHTKIGRFVELKKTFVDEGSKVPHLSYIGDTDIGKNVNIGAGVITVNYDGKVKSKTVIEDNAFVGCNANLIAPVTIGENVYVAAGSTITDDVEKDALAIARERQTVKKDWRNNRK